MIILNIFLLILKIIGIALLVILGLILFILCLLLFVPIRYDVLAKYQEQPDIRVKISYLLKAVRARYVLSGKESSLSVKVLWFTLMGGDKKKKPKRAKRRKKPEDPKRQEDQKRAEMPEPAVPLSGPSKTENEAEASGRAEIAEKTSPDNGQTVVKEQEPPKSSPVQQKPQQEKSGKKKKQKKNRENNKKTGTDAPSGGIMETIKQIAALIKENKEVIAFLFKQLKALLKHILPGSHVINLKLGLEDPAALGEILGAAAVIRSATNLVINITPFFNEKIMEADCHFKGRIRLGKLLFIALKIYFNKDIKRIIRQVKG